MALKVYDANKDLSILFKTTHDGHLGGSFDTQMYVRNDDPTKYYISGQALFSGTDYTTLSGLRADGWRLKLIPGDRRPTEAEWARAVDQEPIVFPNIGTYLVGDTSTYRSFWLRIVAPGNVDAGAIVGLSVVVKARELPVNV